MLKPPVWTWEVPVYFFVGGLAGGAAILAWAARFWAPLGAGVLVPPVARAALWIGLIGAALSAVLLVMDLGRPARFFYMLRLFKWRSPMSMGVWILSAFGGAITLAVAGAELGVRGVAPGPAQVALIVGSWGAALSGALLATYTGVLLGATAVPAWNLHRGTLPVHFGTAGLGSAAALLELLGHGSAPLWWIGVGAAAIETLIAIRSEVSRHGPADRALRSGRAGLILRAAAVLSGPAALGLRLLGIVPLAGVSFLAGALLSRFGWLAAGRDSARDPAAALARYGGC